MQMSATMIMMDTCLGQVLSLVVAVGPSGWNVDIIISIFLDEKMNFRDINYFAKTT